MEPTPNQRLSGDQFTNLQHNAPTVMEDCGAVHGDRLMILHLEAFAADHADLDADFSHELDDSNLDYRFEACGKCMDLGMQRVFEKTVEQLGEMPTFPDEK